MDRKFSFKSVIQTLLIFVTLVIVSQFYGFVFTLEFFLRRVYLLLAVIALFIYLLSRNNTDYNNSIFVKEFKFLYLWSLIPAFSTVFFGGSFIDELFNGIAFSFPAVVYPAFYKFKVSEKVILCAFTLFSLFAVLIQIVVQIHPEYSFFGAKSEDELLASDLRNNLYRVRPGCIQMTVCCCLFFWCKIKSKFNIFCIILFVIMLVGIYLELTRQVMLGLGVAILYTIFVGRKSGGGTKMTLLLFLLLSIIIYSCWDLLFEEFVSDYKDDSFTTDIRIKCLSFTLDQLLSSPILSFLGHGHLEIESKVWWVKYHYFMSDIGFVGEAFYKGFIWIYMYFRMMYLLFMKYKKQVPLYIKAFILATGSISIFMFPYGSQMGLFVWVSMLYIASLSINKSRHQLYAPIPQSYSMD